MEYTTQMDAARKGIFTPEMAKVAEKEHLEPKKTHGAHGGGQGHHPVQ